jgi:hypothetical protein
MSALVGWVGGKEGQPLSLACQGLEIAENHPVLSKNHVIRDKNGQSRIGLAFLPEKTSIPGSVQNKFTKLFTSPIPDWIWLKGWLPSDMTISDWFAGSGLAETTAIACLAEITSYDNYLPFSAPVEVASHLIGATVGLVTDLVNHVPDVKKFAIENRERPEDGDGIILTRYISQESSKRGMVETSDWLSRLPFGIKSVFFELSADETIVYLVRSLNSVEPNPFFGKPNLHYLTSRGTLCFSTLAEQLSALDLNGIVTPVNIGSVIAVRQNFTP